METEESRQMLRINGKWDELNNCPLEDSPVRPEPTSTDQRDYGDEDPEIPNYALISEPDEPCGATAACGPDMSYARIRALEMAMDTHRSNKYGRIKVSQTAILVTAKRYLSFIEG
jgi:hypothetical protein